MVVVGQGTIDAVIETDDSAVTYEVFDNAVQFNLKGVGELRVNGEIACNAYSIPSENKGVLEARIDSEIIVATRQRFGRRLVLDIYASRDYVVMNFHTTDCGGSWWDDLTLGCYVNGQTQKWLRSRSATATVRDAFQDYFARGLESC